jgi:lipopolysaccharide/colanic/teichoic acid biosynthesis glycosyltransferase
MRELPRIPSAAANRLRARFSLLGWRVRRRVPTVLKRSIDLAVVLGAGVLLAPLLLLIALAVRLQDAGPALYWQQRVGKDGQLFAFPKFRSMRTDADRLRTELAAVNHHGAQGVTFKMKRDPRITPIGRWLRRLSLDELPQLWCVLKGDMSLVGPRPALPGEVARYTQDERARLAVRPGLTCIWQVSGRSDVPFPQQVEMDLDYIRAPSVWADLWLLLRTLPAVILGRGAY